MDELEKTAETNIDDEVDIDAVDDYAGVDQEEEELDTQEGENDAEAAEPQDVKPVQTADENAKNARIRREKERAEELRKAHEKGLIEAVKGINPYTNEPIKDEQDMKEFIEMLEIDKAGGDPVTDYSKHLKEKARKDSESSKSPRSKEWIDSDKEKFSKAHPDLDMEKLMGDKKFIAFADGKIGYKTFEQIFTEYMGVVGEYEQEADKKAQRLFAKSKASPGSLSGGDSKPLSIANMSDDELEQMIAKAKRGDFKKIDRS